MHDIIIVQPNTSTVNNFNGQIIIFGTKWDFNINYANFDKYLIKIIIFLENSDYFVNISTYNTQTIINKLTTLKNDTKKYNIKIISYKNNDENSVVVKYQTLYNTVVHRKMIQIKNISIEFRHEISLFCNDVLNISRYVL